MASFKSYLIFCVLVSTATIIMARDASQLRNVCWNLYDKCIKTADAAADPKNFRATLHEYYQCVKKKQKCINVARALEKQKDRRRKRELNKSLDTLW
jgi:hypothetical protein